MPKTQVDLVAQVLKTGQKVDVWAEDGRLFFLLEVPLAAKKDREYRTGGKYQTFIESGKRDLGNGWKLDMALWRTIEAPQPKAQPTRSFVRGHYRTRKPKTQKSQALSLAEALLAGAGL